MSDPRYPIGKFSYSGPPTAEEKQRYLTNIEETPARLRAALGGLSDQQIDTPYRDGGWTLRQLAHHVPDSQIGRASCRGPFGFAQGRLFDSAKPIAALLACLRSG